MECGFLSQKGSGGGRGVKEKNKVVAAQDVVLPSVIDETVNPDVSLLKEDVGNIPAWVKLHGVHVMASSYARAMIELRDDMELKDTIMVAMPKLTGRGDFNKVRSEYERFGTMFNASGANAFNHFISSPGLVDLPFEGKSNKGLVNERALLLKYLQDINSRHSLDMIQKAKIRWAIEGDENSRYFHGIINKMRSQLAIRGVLVDGERIDDPSKVKNEFLNHFSNRFSKPTGPVMSLDPQMFKHLSPKQNLDLERIKKAI
nr:RNA-directed DNA polymerase, eukaryota [Tanacetum cinerariifolium]